MYYIVSYYIQLTRVTLSREALKMLRLVSELADAAFEGVESNLDVFELGLHLLHLLDQEVDARDRVGLIPEACQDALDVPVDAFYLFSNRQFGFFIHDSVNCFGSGCSIDSLILSDSPIGTFALSADERPPWIPLDEPAGARV